MAFRHLSRARLGVVGGSLVAALDLFVIFYTPLTQPSAGNMFDFYHF